MYIKLKLDSTGVLFKINTEIKIQSYACMHVCANMSYSGYNY